MHLAYPLLKAVFSGGFSIDFWSAKQMARVTGSWAYGTPHLESDLDLVVQMTHEDEKTLRLALSLPTEGVIRSGKLNLIVARTDQQYELWCQGTDELIALTELKEIFGSRCPVGRDQAVLHFVELFRKHGLECFENSAGSGSI